MVGTLQPLGSNLKIVNPDGTPTDYFIRWAQQRQIDIGDAVSQAVLDAAFASKDIIAGDGLDGGGSLANDVTLTADVQEILDQITTTHGAILYRDSGGWAALSPGTSGQFLKTNGAGADPSWASGGSGGGGDILDLLASDSAIILPNVNAASVTTLGTLATLTDASALSVSAGTALGRRTGIAVSSSANSFAQIRVANSMNNRARGFEYESIFAIETAGASNCRMIVGLQSGWSGATDPSTCTSSIFVGKDSADTNLKIFHNDNTGSATKIDLGANFPYGTAGALYRVRFTAGAGGNIDYEVTRLDVSHTASGTITTDLPVTTTYMSMGMWSATGATATGWTLALLGMAVKSSVY